MARLAKALAGGFLIVLSGWLAACADDFGTPCNFPDAPEIQQFCATTTDERGNESTSTCLDPINPDCSTRLCVVFQGSDAFCSQRCSSDGGCPGGSRCEFPLGLSVGVCVPNRFEN